MKKDKVNKAFKNALKGIEGLTFGEAYNVAMMLYAAVVTGQASEKSKAERHKIYEACIKDLLKTLKKY